MYFLTEDDRGWINRLIKDYKAGRVNMSAQQSGNAEQEIQEGKSHHNTDLYVAKTPADGLPGMNGIVPGRAVCDVYQISFDDNDEPSILPIEGYDDYVYNISSEISGNTFVLISREKHGEWIVLTTSLASDVRIELVESTASVHGLQAWICNVLSKSCGGTVAQTLGSGSGSGSIGYIPQIVVVDALGCLFDGTEQAGDKGYAKLMNPLDYYGTGTTELDTGTGSGPASSECRYECYSLCCPRN